MVRLYLRASPHQCILLGIQIVCEWRYLLCTRILSHQQPHVARIGFVVAEDRVGPGLLSPFGACNQGACGKRCVAGADGARAFKVVFLSVSPPDSSSCGSSSVELPAEEWVAESEWSSVGGWMGLR